MQNVVSTMLWSDIQQLTLTSSNDVEAIAFPTAAATSIEITSGEVQKVKDLRESEDENNRLHDARECKICMSNEIAVVFIPCGHLGKPWF